ncbi:MAG: UDP-N-acetylglucosamine--N-acetylmuramyl-(pentapeptide) pyrophosphoryl-undecaprenol N-acetylglucosamine transferase [Planctomycetes bacterium]|nr:UDP-N-acetylglucosamine--N-acetylmuramyl-(pentapeptide) pyrophosphoryl-undecaprenol N-acetylglucosamine transferase [Planctomycetota bacterium]
MFRKSYYKIVFAGGGTGGHLAPGIAVAEECIYATDCEIEFLIVGKQVEKMMLEKKKFKYSKMQGAPLRKSIRGLFAFVALNLIGFVRSFIKFLGKRPDAVICLGGYGAFSSAYSAKILKIPVFVLEQNTIPGKVNRIISKFSKQIFSQWKIDDKWLPKQANQSVQGNPIRNEIFESDKKTSLESLGLSSRKPTLLVLGGSQGAIKINDFVLDNLETIRHHDIQMIFLTGKHDFERVNKVLDKNPNFMVMPFSTDMGKILNAADFVISRAGATTIAELTALGKPMMLIPYPYAAERHQHKNAEYVTKAGAAIMYEEDRLTKDVWDLILNDVLLDYDNLREMSRNSSIIGRPFAGKSIAIEILNHIRQSKQINEPIVSKAGLIRHSNKPTHQLNDNGCILLAPDPDEIEKKVAA